MDTYGDVSYGCEICGKFIKLGFFAKEIDEYGDSCTIEICESCWNKIED